MRWSVIGYGYEKSGRALAFVTCKTRVGHGFDVFDVPCVVTTKVCLTFPHVPTLPTISVGFGVWSSVQGLEADMFVGVLNMSIPRSALLGRL